MIERNCLFFSLVLFLALVTMYGATAHNENILLFLAKNIILVLIILSLAGVAIARVYLKIKYKIYKEQEKLKIAELISKWQRKL